MKKLFTAKRYIALLMCLAMLCVYIQPMSVAYAASDTQYVAIENLKDITVIGTNTSAVTFNLVGTYSAVSAATVTAVSSDTSFLANPTPVNNGGLISMNITPKYMGGSAHVTVTAQIGSYTTSKTIIIDEPSKSGNDNVITKINTPIAINVLNNDYIPAGATYGISQTTPPAHGSIVLNADKTITYTPSTGFTGLDTFTYVYWYSSSGSGDESDLTVTVDVYDGNVPSAVYDDAGVAIQGESKVIDVLANDTDADGNTLTITNVTKPQHGTTSITTGKITYAPDMNWNGPDAFNYTITDGHGGYSTGLVEIFVNQRSNNTNPDAANDTATTKINTSVNFSVLNNDTDPEGDTLFVLSASVPAHGALNYLDKGPYYMLDSGTFSYTPNTGWFGTDTFTYTISDGHGGTDTATVTVNVTRLNYEPVAANDSTTGTEDTTTTISVLGNDTDANGDTLTVTSTTTPLHGSTVINANNTISYTPNANWYGIDTFDYTVSDGYGGTDTATVTINVYSINDNPVSLDDTATTNEDTYVNINVLANDTDVEGNTLTITGISQPGHGTVSINADKTVKYTPSANWNGMDTFTYTISDGHGGTSTATVTVTVEAVNDPPVAVDDTAATTNCDTVNINILGNDYDVDGDTITLTNVDNQYQYLGSVITVQSNKTINYTPGKSYTHQESFTYDISDGHGGTSTGHVTINITSSNRAPVANADTVTTSEDTPITIDVLNNDTDADNDSLKIDYISYIISPQIGSAVISENKIVYTPKPNYSGSDTIAYTISDGHGGSDEAYILITVTDVNDPPVAVNDSATTNEDASVDVDVLYNDSDADSDTLAVTNVATPGHGTAAINVNGTIKYTPNTNWNGTDTLTYTVSDGKGGTNTATVTITVNPGNDAPDAVNDNATTNKNNSVDINVLANDTDIDADTLLVASVATPGHGTAVINANGTVKYTPNLDWTGTDTFTYTISDGHGGTDTATVTITVNNRPNVANDSATTNEDTSVDIDVLNNDSDADADTLVVTNITTPGHGTAIINANGTIKYTPNTNWNGTDTLTYTVSDGKGGTAVGTVTVTVNPVNDPPTANDDYAAMIANTSTNINVLANDSDVDGNRLTVKNVANPSNGSVRLNADGTITYTPNLYWTGYDTIYYTVTDGINDTTARATVNVYYLPRAYDSSISTTRNFGVNGNVSGDYWIYSLSRGPSHGEVTLNWNGSYSYTPYSGFVGIDTFAFVCSNGIATTAPSTVTIFVNPPPIIGKVSTSSYKIKAGPGPKYATIGTVKRNTTWTILNANVRGTDRAKWYQISYNGQIGYIRYNYIKILADPAPSNGELLPSGSVIKITTSSYNIKSGAGTRFSNLGKVKRNTTWVVLRKNVKGTDKANWYQVLYNGRIGYIRYNYAKQIR